MNENWTKNVEKMLASLNKYNLSRLVAENKERLVSLFYHRSEHT